MIRTTILAGLVAVVTALPSVQAADDPYAPFRNDGNNYDDRLEIPWVESEQNIPALPRDEDLIAVRMDDMPSELALYVDPKGATLDDRDGTTRLWLVIKSRAGAYNASYEGYRCGLGEYKIYAYGNPNRAQPVSPVRTTVWRNIPLHGGGAYRAEFARDFLCIGPIARTAHQISDALRGLAPSKQGRFLEQN